MSARDAYIDATRSAAAAWAEVERHSALYKAAQTAAYAADDAMRAAREAAWAEFTAYVEAAK